jgi:UDP-N-acetylmuramate dehydrogenase
LALTPDDPRAVARRVQRLWAFKRATQDWTAPSAGCIFKNPTDARLPGDPPREGQVPAAGWLIDRAGLKGYRVGGAAISLSHANFMMNLGNARACDVLTLIEEVRTRVKRSFGVELELEVQILPERFFP